MPSRPARRRRVLRLLAAVVLAVALAALALLPAMARAQDDGAAPVARAVTADTVVVTATRSPAAARTTGRRVTVWTQADLQALAVTSYDELLRTVGGVDVQSRAAFGVQSDLTLRGSTFNGVLVLLDGARLNDPMTGHFLSDLPVPLSEIARVEVLRGPAAALYGPDALGGVVHLMTRTALGDAAGAADGSAADGIAAGGGAAGGWQGQAHGRYGAQADVHDVEGRLARAGRRTTASVAVAAQGSPGEIVTGDGGQPVRYASGGPVRTDFTRRAATVAVRHRLGAVAPGGGRAPGGGPTVYTRVGVDDRDFSAFHFYTPFASDKAREATRTWWLQSRASGTAGRTRWQAQVAGKQHHDTYAYNEAATPSRHTSRLLTAQAQATRAVAPGLALTGGLAGQARGIDSNTMGLRREAAGGAFAGARWQPARGLTLNASARADLDPAFGLEVTPNLFAAYTRGAVTLRAGGGRAVRAPNYVERYLDAGGNQGNPALDAERAWSYEGGVDVRPGGTGLALHATAFARHTRDLIDYAQLAPSEEVFVARNVLAVDTRGLELEATLDRTVAPSLFGEPVRLRLGTAYTLLDATLDARADAPADSVTFKYALTNARHLVQGAATVVRGGVSLGVRGQWKERLAANPFGPDRYGLVHLRGRVRLTPPGPAPVVLTAEVRNLFDADVAEVFDAPLPGRQWLVGVAVGW